MEKERLESMIIDLLDGNLSKQDVQLIEQEIKSNPEVALIFNQTKRLFEVISRSAAVEPSQSMKKKFDLELQSAIAGQRKEAKVVAMGFQLAYRIAAGVVLVLASGALFYWINRSIEQEHQLAKLQKEMQETKSVMMAMLGNQSAGQRIQGTNVALKIEKADDEIVNALVKTMDSDPNTNVRLAALDALSKFHEQPHVRAAMVKSLATQTDAAVQIALIRLLVEMKEKQTLKELRRISTDDTVIQAVQDEAHAGILKLS